MPLKGNSEIKDLSSAGRRVLRVKVWQRLTKGCSPMVPGQEGSWEATDV